MRFYETLYIVDANLENKALEKAMEDIGKELEKTKSKIINHRVWGKKRLAYAIQRQKYGSYIILQYAGGDLNKTSDFDTWMKLNNSVLRHMTVILDEEPKLYIEEEKAEQINESLEQEDSKQVEDDKKPNSDDSNLEKEEIDNVEEKDKEIKIEEESVLEEED